MLSSLQCAPTSALARWVTAALPIIISYLRHFTWPFKENISIISLHLTKGFTFNWTKITIVGRGGCSSQGWAQWFDTNDKDSILWYSVMEYSWRWMVSGSVDAKDNVLCNI
jgi:hypothetical protein